LPPPPISPGAEPVSGRRYPSSLEVARKAGVSQSAVSRTFTPGACVSAATRAKVMEAAEALGYRPSLIPKIMLTNRSRMVAVVVGGLHNPFYAAVLERFAQALRQDGNQVLMVPAESVHALDDVLDELAGYRVDAVISSLEILSHAAAEALSALRIPVVSFNTTVSAPWVGSVCADNADAAEAIAHLLHRRGGRRFAYISGPAASPSHIEREAGFRQGLARLGIDRLAMGNGDFTRNGGHRAMLELLAAGERPDALFCANDLSAFGAMDALRQHGLRVPEDVLVCGFDDAPQAGWGGYELTSMAQDIDAMVGTVMAMLAKARDEGASAMRRVIVPSILVERGSTKGLAEG
jgi:DNA-binding LacI/PurR family transcriptional regulator